MLVFEPNRDLDELVETLIFGNDRSTEIRKWTSSFDLAFQVMAEMRKKRFSVRQIFLKRIQLEVSDRIVSDKKTQIAWPDIIFFLTPEDICHAAVETVTEQMLSRNIVEFKKKNK